MKSILEARNLAWKLGAIKFPDNYMKVEFITAIFSDGSWHGNWIFLRRVTLHQLRFVYLCGIFKCFRKITKKTI